MFSDSILEKIFSHEEMQKIPVGTQATAVRAFEEVLENIIKENQYVTVAELFIPTTDE